MSPSAVISAPPRVLVVSRAFVRKNKMVDFVGEYHLELLVRFGACPIIVPRVEGIADMLDSFEPIHGVLLIEGQDVDPTRYGDASMEDADGADRDGAQWRKLHASDTELDSSKDDIEFELARRCIERRIPFLGICRGAQVFNVANGGSLFTDVESELGSVHGNARVCHVDYTNYDAHRHPVELVPRTPLHSWFNFLPELSVNSYHHQGVRRLAPRFEPMAFAPDGLIEAYWDPLCFSPKDGEFAMGFQFHPERMRDSNGQLEFEGCAKVYEAFATACRVYERRALNCAMREIEASMEVERARRLRTLQVFTRSNTSEGCHNAELSAILKRPRSATVHGAVDALSLLETQCMDVVDMLSVDATAATTS